VSETGVDGVLLGRAAQGNPWIFRAKDKVKLALRSAADIKIETPSVGLEERFSVLLEHCRHFEKNTMIRSFVGMRKHLAWYCYGSPGAAELRAQMVRVNDIGDVVERLRVYTGKFGSRHEPFALLVGDGDPQAGNSDCLFS
jgi:tRNA-dihydrouridine synthase B